MNATENKMDRRSGGYKRNWVKWVGLYLAIGAVVYFIIYLVAFHHGGTGGGY